MYISLNWIKDFVNLDGVNIKELAYKFTVSTAEIEEVVEVGKNIQNVIVGKVLEVHQHPDSEKLKLVKIDTGDGVVQSVCGAKNIREGILIPFAKVGGSLKKIAKVEKTMIAGEESNGICCAADEIGISDDHSGLLILEGDYKVGTNIKDIIEIDDVIIEIDNKSITNRPDLWGHYGIAREIAALTKRKLAPLEVSSLKYSETLPKIDVVVEDKEKCLRYSCISMDNIKVKKSHINMQTRLYYCGMRPISLLVDLTNYLMLELGQPMHAFDKRLMEKVVVRSTKEPTKFKTLDGNERTIPANVLMICNQERPVGIAGIMGGENSEVSDDTEAIMLESATFESASTRINAAKMGLRTEASARFEKSLDPETTVLAIKRFAKLLLDADKSAKLSSSLTDLYLQKNNKITININKPYINKWIGYDIDNNLIVEILKSLEFEVKVDKDNFEIGVPSFRSTKDISIKADIIEEISRIYGYDNIEPKTTEAVLEPLNYNKDRIIDHKVKEILAENHGLSEVHSHIWYDHKNNTSLGIGIREGVKLANSSMENMDTLRDSMVPTMLNFAVVNKKNYDDFGMFEIGSVFTSIGKDKNCEEHKNLCVLFASKAESEDHLFYKVKGITTQIFTLLKKVRIEYSAVGEDLQYPWIHPVKATEVSYNGQNLGYISVLHPKIKENIDRKLNIVILELNMFMLYDIEEKLLNYQEPSKYPEVTLDFSLLTDKAITYDELNSNLNEFKNELLLSHKFIDIYTGKGVPEDKKSMTFSFRIGSKEGTLSSEQIEDLSKKLIEYFQSKGYNLR